MCATPRGVPRRLAFANIFGCRMTIYRPDWLTGAYDPPIASKAAIIRRELAQFATGWTPGSRQQARPGCRRNERLERGQAMAALVQQVRRLRPQEFSALTPVEEAPKALLGVCRFIRRPARVTPPRVHASRRLVSWACRMHGSSALVSYLAVCGNMRLTCSFTVLLPV